MIKILARSDAPGDESDTESSDDGDGAVIGIRDIGSDDSELGYSMDDFCVPEPENEEISDGSVATAADLSDCGQ
jgi:hypothetical protein